MAYTKKQKAAYDSEPMTTVRCSQCYLMQFAAKRCRRCKHELREPEKDEPVTVPEERPMDEGEVQGWSWRSKGFHRSMAKRIGARCKSARLKKSMSQNVLARISGFVRTYISRVENGILEPQIPRIERLADALKVPPWYFVASDRDLMARDLLGDPFLVNFVGLEPQQRNEVLEYARSLNAK